MPKQPGWLPRGLQELAAWFDNFNLKFAQLATTLGFNAADKTAVAADNATVQYLAQADIALDNDTDAFRKFRNAMLNNPIGSPPPSLPAFVMPTAPAFVDVGIVDRIDNLADRIEMATGYAPEIGAQLGIINTKPEPVPPDSMKPELKVKALPASQIEISFVRGRSDGIKFEIKRQDETGWTDFNNYFQSPAILTVAPKVPHAPEQIMIRARYLKNNEQIGDFSDIISMVTTP